MAIVVSYESKSGKNSAEKILTFKVTFINCLTSFELFHRTNYTNA